MSVRIRKAITSEAKPLVGLYSESGGGKTFSSLLLAKGFVGDMSRVVMIETESGRGEAWADHPVVGGYNVLPLRSDFSPKTYGAAIAEAESVNAQGLIIDSASHEWEGVGGVLGMAEKNREAGQKGVLIWQKPKMDHAREFMLRLTQTPIPLVIVCMRAKYPMYEVTAADLKKWEEAGRPGKQAKVGDWARSWKLEPKQADDILFDMFVHGWLDQERHAFHGTKYTVDAFRKIFVDGEPISVETGQRLAQWASGRATAPSTDALARMKTAAANGTDALKAEWSKATKDEQRAIGKDGLEALKRTAAERDNQPEDDLDFGAPITTSAASNGNGESAKPMFDYTEVRAAIDNAGKAKNDERMSVAEDQIVGTAPQFHTELQELARGYRAGW